MVTFFIKGCGDIFLLRIVVTFFYSKGYGSKIFIIKPQIFEKQNNDKSFFVGFAKLSQLPIIPPSIIKIIIIKIIPPSIITIIIIKIIPPSIITIIHHYITW